MLYKNRSLVTGANGHLGNNLVRYLINKGIPVRASVRNIGNTQALAGLDCEIVQAEMTEKESLSRALEGISICYAVGAVNKLWAKDPVKEIYDTNMLCTKNLIEAAATAGVKRIVYVSSIGALNAQEVPISEKNGFNKNRQNVYYNSKNDSEQLAFELAAKYAIELVTVLPSSMIGGEAFFPLTGSYDIINMIINNQIPVDTNFSFNWVDVRDVAEGCYLANQFGRNGERYILSNEKGMTLQETIHIGRELFPESGIKKAVRLPYPLLYGIAFVLEKLSSLQGKPPIISARDLAFFSNKKLDFDISTSREVLGFHPKSPDQVVKDAMSYLRRKVSDK